MRGLFPPAVPAQRIHSDPKPLRQVGWFAPDAVLAVAPHQARCLQLTLADDTDARIAGRLVQRDVLHGVGAVQIDR